MFIFTIFSVRSFHAFSFKDHSQQCLQYLHIIIEISHAFYTWTSSLTFLMNIIFLQNLSRQNSYNDLSLKIKYAGFVDLIWNNISFFIAILYLITIPLGYTSTPSRCWVSLWWIQKSLNSNTRLLQNISSIFVSLTFITKLN